MESLRVVSEQRGNSLHHNFDLVEQGEDQGTQRPDLHVQKDCVLLYTPKHQIKRYLVCHTQQSRGPVVKRSRRSDIDLFNFKEHCLICGEACSTKQNPKILSHWRHVQSKTADHGTNRLQRCNSKCMWFM